MLNEALGKTTDENKWVTQAQLNRLRELEERKGHSEAEWKEFGELADNGSRNVVQERRYQQLKRCEKRQPKEEAEYQKLASTDGVLIYIKASLNGNEPADVSQYYKSHDAFPHESTANQFFNESQFQSYVRLGMHVVDEIMHSDSSLATLDEFIDAAAKNSVSIKNAQFTLMDGLHLP